MKKKVSLTILVLILLLVGFFNSCQVGRMIVYNFADITDYKIFSSRPLHGSNKPFHFIEHPTPTAPNINGFSSIDDYLEVNKTVAFLVIRNDTIQYENYYHKYDKESIVASFSMAKSVTSMLIGCALEDGLIASVDDPIIQYIPELKDNGLEKVTIRHLLLMTSGIDFNESYANPFGDAASFYYGTNLRKVLYKMKLKREPGKQFEYISGNTQLLGLILNNVLKDKTITEYLNEKIWQPVGMEYDASWSIDHKGEDGLEKTFCCLNARARDFAKLGRLYLNNGRWDGKQVVPESWVKESTQLSTVDGSAWYYQYQWWIPDKDGSFMAEGILGQFIYINPNKNLIVVRLGKNTGKVNWWNFFSELSKQY